MIFTLQNTNKLNKCVVQKQKKAQSKNQLQIHSFGRSCERERHLFDCIIYWFHLAFKNFVHKVLF